MAERHNELRPSLEAVFFDVGGTLVRLDFEWIARMLFGLGVGVTAESLRRAEVRGRRMYDTAAARGGVPPGSAHANATLASIEAYFTGMLEGAGCRHPLLEEAVAEMWARQASGGMLWARANEGAREGVAGVRALGLRAACISNSDGRAEEHFVQTGTRDGLEFVVDSHVEGVEKPDPEIFRRAFARMGVAPERSLYVGDLRSVDEAGARAAGMHFVLLDPFGDYAGEDTRAIPEIDRLPAYVREHFATPAPGGNRPDGAIT
jgi:HAD superfamily hydrolase (TIGR01549 family)